MSLITLNQCYVPLIQKPECCAMACLQMILYRNGLGLFDQEQLAIRFGVKISPENAPYFNSNMQVLTSMNLDEGIPTVESEEIINSFLKEISAPFKAKSFKSSTISSISSFLEEHIKANHDLWIEYHAHDIHPYDRFEGKTIHDGLIESFDTTAEVVTVIDPFPEHRQRIVISLPVLETAISKKYGRETGFVVIEPT